MDGGGRVAPGAATEIKHKRNTGEDIVSYLHTDHLATPKIATNPTGTVVWRWESRAFGNYKIEKDPDGDGTNVNVRLRFPGQFKDGESGLYYNWNRYYDPAIGRYVTSDPIGLDGGPNSYLYVGANPLSSIDPTGLLEWTGTFRIRGGSLFKTGGIKAEFMLTSECDINGRRATVKVEATQFNVGIGTPVENWVQTRINTLRHHCWREQEPVQGRGAH